jgi:hypothetical protein
MPLARPTRIVPRFEVGWRVARRLSVIADDRGKCAANSAYQKLTTISLKTSEGIAPISLTLEINR